MTTRFIKKPIKRKPMRESYEDFVIENGVLVRYRGNDTDIVVPDEVREIGKGAFKDFKYESQVKNIKMPNVKVVGQGAFNYCTQLISVSMPKATEVGSGAFSACFALTDVHMPNALTIGDDAFENCASLTKVEGSRVTSIGAGAFSYSGIQVADFPNATEVGIMAFQECDSLTNVFLPSVKRIGKMAFYACHKLSVVNLPKVDEVGESAFTFCFHLSDIHINPSVRIDKYAFNATPVEQKVKEQFGLTERMSRKHRKSMREEVEDVGDFEVRFGRIEKYRGNGGDVVIPDGITGIGKGAFRYCTSLTSITMPTVKYVSEEAFLGCRNMISVDAPVLESVGDSAFADCYGLRSFYAPRLQRVDDYAFSFCRSLKDMTVPARIFLQRKPNAFYDCPAAIKFLSSRNKARTRKDERFVRRAKGIREADGDMKTYEIVYTVDGTLSKQKVRAASQTEAESLIKERNKGNVVIQTAKEIRGITEDVDGDVRPSPESGAATGIAGMLIDAINDEWETINRYNSMVATIRSMLEDIDNIEGVTAGDLQDTVEIIENINNEENNHVGMLQSALALYSENVETIKDGEKEADGIMTDVADGEIIKDEFADDEYVGRLVKNVKGVVVDA